MNIIFKTQLDHISIEMTFTLRYDRAIGLFCMPIDKLICIEKGYFFLTVGKGFVA